MTCVRCNRLRYAKRTHQARHGGARLAVDGVADQYEVVCVQAGGVRARRPQQVGAGHLHGGVQLAGEGAEQRGLAHGYFGAGTVLTGDRHNLQRQHPQVVLADLSEQGVVNGGGGVGWGGLYIPAQTKP